MLLAILMEMTAIVDDTPTLRVQVVLIYGFRYPKRPQSPYIMGTWTLRATDRHLLRLQLLGFTKLLTPLPGLGANALLTAAAQGRGVHLGLFVVPIRVRNGPMKLT